MTEELEAQEGEEGLAQIQEAGGNTAENIVEACKPESVEGEEGASEQGAELNVVDKGGEMEEGNKSEVFEEEPKETDELSQVEEVPRRLQIQLPVLENDTETEEASISENVEGEEEHKEQQVEVKVRDSEIEGDRMRSQESVNVLEETKKKDPKETPCTLVYSLIAPQERKSELAENPFEAIGEVEERKLATELYPERFLLGALIKEDYPEGEISRDQGSFDEPRGGCGYCCSGAYIRSLSEVAGLVGR